MSWLILFAVRRFIGFILFVGGAGLALYLLFCDQLGRLSDTAIAAPVNVIGIVSESQAVPNSPGYGFYKIRDPTGESYVITPYGPPADAAVVFVHGTKQDKNGHTVVVEKLRIGSF